jgi:hypothetical protein
LTEGVEYRLVLVHDLIGVKLPGDPARLRAPAPA